MIKTQKSTSFTIRDIIFIAIKDERQLLMLVI